MIHRSQRVLQRLSIAICGIAISGCSTVTVRSGIDVLADSGFAALQGQRIALISNHTGISRSGQSTIRLLNEAPGVELVRIFSPEHGIAGQLDIPIIEDGVENGTGIEIVSLYGDVRRPTPAMLAGIDTLVFDIQDIGARFYTYISTMGNAMEAAADSDVRFVVLDRPNPINGVRLAGPMLDAGKESFVGFHRLPVQHGMTVGELAMLFRSERALQVDLRVIPVSGWRRRDYFDATGLPWVNPSPNIRNLTAALLYPGIGLLESTNLSVGRGTSTPFEILGAPWLDAESLAAALRQADLPGVDITATQFMPTSSKFVNELCHGVQFAITDRRRFDPLRLGLEIAHILVTDYADTWAAGDMLRLLGNDAVLADIIAGNDAETIIGNYQLFLNAFAQRRENFLLYR